MSGADNNRPGGKSGRRSRKTGQKRSPQPDQPQEIKPSIDAAVASTDTSQVHSQAGTAAAANTPSIGFQTIATAYSDYTRKSFEEAQSFVEKLSGVRSLDKALEVQAEFAKQAYETFVADSQKIRELYGELARQTLKPSKSPPAAR